MTGRRAAVGAAFLTLMAAQATEARPLRVMALDQCADQYALALRPDAELLLSPRVDDPDSWMREAAKGRGRARPSLETVVWFRPDVVVRYWGGDARLLARLEADGVRVLNLEDATDFDGVTGNLRVAGEALDATGRAEALEARMRGQLAAAGKPGARGEAVYLTAGGFTAGAGTLVDAILRAAGFRNGTTTPGYGPVSAEGAALEPPRRWVLGFFDLFRNDRRAAGRHPVIARQTRDGAASQLPAAALTCPAWFAGDAVAMLAGQE